MQLPRVRMCIEGPPASRRRGLTLTGGGGNALLGARFEFDGGGLRFGGKLPRLAELLRPGPLVCGGADRRPPQLAYLPVFDTVSRRTGTSCTCQGKESQLCWVMREEWGFRFFICAAGAIPVVVVFILLFKK